MPRRRRPAGNLIALAEKRGTEDNLSIQIVEIGRVEQLMYYRGLPIYHEPELSMSNELETGQVLDGRFHIRRSSAAAAWPRSTRSRTSRRAKCWR